MIDRRLTGQVARNTSRLPTVREDSKTVLSSNAPITTSRALLSWRIRQYVYDSGASHEPVLSDMTTPLGSSTATDFMVQCSGGMFKDEIHEQYSHKMYSVRLHADQPITIAMKIRWFEQLSVITEHDDVETTVYTTGTDDNNFERILVDLKYGTTDLHVLMYTGTTDQQCEITVDMAGIHLPLLYLGSRMMV